MRFNDTYIHVVCPGHWWVPSERRWFPAAETPFGKGAAAQVDCRTVRAFRRHLRRYGRKGAVYELIHRWDGAWDLIAEAGVSGRRRKRRFPGRKRLSRGT